MTLGLIDNDIFLKSPKKALNVELMKTAKYYEDNGWEVKVLLPTDDIFCYEKIIVFGNRRDVPEKNRLLYQKHPNIDYYGLIFNNLVYQPIDSDELNNCPVNTKYYEELLEYMYNRGIYTEKDVKTMLKINWVRLFPKYNKPINTAPMFNGQRYKLVDTNIFDNSNWEQTLLQLSIFGQKISFSQEIVVKSSKDLNNFMKLLKFNFANLQAEIDIEDIEDYLKFLRENQEILRQYPSRFHYNLIYSNNNNYGPTFYEKRIKEIFQIIKEFNDLGIKVEETVFYPQGVKSFAEDLMVFLSMYGMTYHNNNSAFHKFFMKKTKNSINLQMHYKHFLNNHQEYYYWFSRNFKIKEVNNE